MKILLDERSLVQNNTCTLWLCIQVQYSTVGIAVGNQSTVRKRGCFLVQKGEQGSDQERPGTPDTLFLCVIQGDGHKSYIHFKNNWLSLISICVDCSVCDASANFDSYYSHCCSIAHLCPHHVIALCLLGNMMGLLPFIHGFQECIKICFFFFFLKSCQHLFCLWCDTISQPFKYFLDG